MLCTHTCTTEDTFKNEYHYIYISYFNLDYVPQTYSHRLLLLLLNCFPVKLDIAAHNASTDRNLCNGHCLTDRSSSRPYSSSIHSFIYLLPRSPTISSPVMSHFVIRHTYYTICGMPVYSIDVRTTSEVLSATSQPSLLILASLSYTPPSRAQALLPHIPPNFTMSIVSLGYPGKTDIHTDRNL